MRSFPEDDQRATSSTLLTDPWTAGVTGWIVVLLAALLARRSRIAAWAAIPAAFAGVQLATFFLNQFALYYHLSG